MRSVYGAMLVILLGACQADAAAVFLDRFEQGVGAWATYGGGEPLTTQSEVAKEALALESRYDLAEGFFAVAVTLETPPLAAQSVRFEVRTSQSALLLVGLTEADGSRYQTLVNSQPETWQTVDVSFDRLRLAEDSSDENDALDVEEITVVGVADVSTLFGDLFATGGARTLWLDDFSLNSEPGPSAYSPDGKLPLMLDRFDSLTPLWLPLEGEVTGEPDEGRIAWTYPGAPLAGRFTALVTATGRLPAEGATHLLLTASAERSTKLVVVLEEEGRDERDKSRYLKVIDLGPGQIETQAIALRDLVLDTSNQGSDENHQFDLDQVATIFFADLEVLMGQQPGTNTIWFDELELIGQP